MRIVSVERGRDPRRYGLVAFGGAGPLHAARLARALGIPKMIVPWGAGVGSAIGLLASQHQARSVADASSRAARRRRSRDHRDLPSAGGAHCTPTLSVCGSRAAAQPDAVCLPALPGQGHEIRVDLPALFPSAKLRCRTSGTVRSGLPRQVRLSASRGRGRGRGLVPGGQIPNGPPGAHGARGWRGGGPRGRVSGNVRPISRNSAAMSNCRLRAWAAGDGEVIAGPAIIEEAEATTVMPPGSMAASVNAGIS